MNGQSICWEPGDFSPVTGWVTLDLAVGFRVPLCKIMWLRLGVSEGSTSLQLQVFSIPREVWLDMNWLSCPVGEMEDSARFEVQIWGALRCLEQNVSRLEPVALARASNDGGSRNSM